MCVCALWWCTNLATHKRTLPFPPRPSSATPTAASLVAHLLEQARASGCYKVILDCTEHNVGYYEKCGLTRKEAQMVKYFDR